MKMTAVFLYVLFETSASNSVLRWRVPQPDMKTCLEVAKETKAIMPQSSDENELAVVVTCGGKDVQHYWNGWQNGGSDK